MIKKTLVRKLSWVDLEKDICNETNTKTIFLFGIKLYVCVFECSHNNVEAVENDKIGFK